MLEFSPRRSAQIAAIFLLSVVVTQIIYFALHSAGLEINRPIIWTTEAAVFLGISIFALIPLVRGSEAAIAWAAIATGGLLNVIQVGMGLAMFGPVKEAGEAMAPAFQAILAGAFWLYFAGKFLFGFAAIVLGGRLAKTGKGAAKAIGMLAIIAGAASMLTNLFGMAMGMDMVFAAGASGTAATLLLAIAIISRLRSQID